MHLQKKGHRACSAGLSAMILYGAGRQGGQLPDDIIKTCDGPGALFFAPGDLAQAVQ